MEQTVPEQLQLVATPKIVRVATPKIVRVAIVQ